MQSGRELRRLAELLYARREAASRQARPNRAFARKNGLTRYFGKPCPRHVEGLGLRQTSNNKCIACEKLRHKIKRTTPGHPVRENMRAYQRNRYKRQKAARKRMPPHVHT